MTENFKKLSLLADQIRQDILKMLNRAGSGHTAGSLGVVEILVSLYFEVLLHRPNQPDWPERDRFILSNGHVCPALYAVLAHAGYFPLDKLLTLRQLGSGLQGHPHYGELPGIETSSGPLGQGVCQAIGFSLAAKLDQKKYHVFCLSSDGEQDQGPVWEAAMFAAKYRLNNLTFIIDRNQIQIDGFTKDIMPLEPLAEKYRAFNWQVLEINGHDFGQIISACKRARQSKDQPTVIIARTVPGKGVRFMENDFHWHGKAPNQEELKLALEQLPHD